jgi:hypothetical protein
MATRKTALEEERMTPQNIEKVIYMLNPPEGSDQRAWTKKEACQFLGMAYNTTRLGSVIETYKEKKLREQQRRAALRGKPATKDEVVYTITEYLNGETVEAISKALFRSTNFVKTILDLNAVPIRQVGHSYFKPQLIPEMAAKEKFQVGETVYSARYDSLAVIEKETQDPRHGWIYRVWLPSERWKQHAWQPSYELATLEHLRKLGVRV